MSTYHLVKLDVLTVRIISACFPEYTGRKVRLCTLMPERIESRWDEGARHDYALYDLASGEVRKTPADFAVNLPIPWPTGLLLVEHYRNGSVDFGITIYASSATLAPMLPEHGELRVDEKIVLEYTYGYKASYAGIANYRFREAHSRTGISAEAWERAKAALISRGLLTTRGAITPAGKNALGVHY